MAIVMFVLALSNFGEQSENQKYLKITIPESLNYDEVFTDILDKYTKSWELETVKTITLGSLFRVEYKIITKDKTSIKQLIDDLRTRNGNLEIVCGKLATSREEL